MWKLFCHFTVVVYGKLYRLKMSFLRDAPSLGRFHIHYTIFLRFLWLLMAYLLFRPQPRADARSAERRMQNAKLIAPAREVQNAELKIDV